MKNPRQSVRANLKWTGLGYGVYLASQFGVISALAHIAGAVEVGRFGLANAIAAPIIALASLGLRIGQATDVIQRYTFAEYFGLRIVTTTIALVGVVALGLALYPEPATLCIVVIVAVNKAIESFSDLFYGSFQQRERSDLVAHSLMYRGPATFVLFLAVLWITKSSAFAFVSQLVVWSGVAFFHDYRIAVPAGTEGGRGPSWNAARLLHLAQHSLPLGTAAFLNALQVSAPRYVVERLLGLKSLGYFTAVAQILQLSTVFANAACQSMLGRLARLQQAGDKKRFLSLIAKTSAVGLAVGLLAVGVAICCGESLLTLAFGRGFAFMEPVLIVITLAIAIRLGGVFLQAGVFAQRRFKAYSLIQVLLFVPTVGLLIVLTRQYGLMGTAAAVLIGISLKTIVLLFETSHGVKSMRPSA